VSIIAFYSKNLLRLIALCANLLFGEVAFAAITLVDDSGATVKLAQPARRIVSLAPHATELIFAAGAGKQVVAVAAYSDWPPEARALPNIGGYHSLDIERIVALKPDLVIGWASGNSAAQIAHLKRLGLPVFLSEPARFEDIATNLERIGLLADSTDSANRAAQSFRARIEALRLRYAAQAPVRVFYQIWPEPIMTLNREHILNQVLTLCGGDNVFGNLSSLVATITEEAVWKAAPEAILAPSEPGIRDNGLARWRRWKTLPAVAQDNLFPVNGDLLNRSGPRIAEGAESVCQLLDQVRAKQRAPAQAAARMPPRLRE
jgi:iron complex transport system substrate-binding protein